MIFKTTFSSYFPDPSCNYSALNPLVTPTAKSSVFQITGCYYLVVKPTSWISNVILF